jgi:hypothetical protein
MELQKLRKVNQLRWDAKIENFDTKTIYIKAKNTPEGVVT